MNRTLILGIAIFFAVVGIALLGSQDQAVAGPGCSGCDGFAVKSCRGRHHRCHVRCSAVKSSCQGPVRHCCGVPTNCRGVVKEPVTCSGRPVRVRCHGKRVRCSGVVGCSGGKWTPVIEPASTDAVWYMDGSFEQSPVAFRRMMFRR